MDKNMKKDLDQAGRELEQDNQTLQKLINTIDQERKTQEAINTKNLKEKKTRTAILAGGIVLAVLIGGTSINNLYQSGAEERSYNSKMDAVIDTAKKYLEDEDYDGVISAVSAIPSDAKQYSDAKYYIDKAQQGKEEQYLTKAEAKEQEGDYAGAVAVCEQAMTDLGVSDRLLEEKNDYLEEMKKTAISQAEEYTSEQNYEKAVEVLKQAADTLAVSGTEEDVQAVNAQAESVREQYKETVLAQAAEKRQEKNFDEAETILTKAYELLPEDGDVAQTLREIQIDVVTLEADGKAEQGDYAGAITVYGKALENLEESEEFDSGREAYLSGCRELALGKSGELLGAGEHYQAMEVLNQAFTVLKTYGTEEDQKAITDKAAEVKKQYKELVLSQAAASRESGDYAAAEAILKDAGELLPRDEDVKALLSQVQVDKALSDIAALEEQGDTKGILSYIADSGLKKEAAIQEKWDAAVAVYASAVVEAAGAKAEEGDFETALSMLDEATSLVGKNDDITTKINLIKSSEIVENGFCGSMQQEEQEDNYSFTAPISGVYRFDMTNNNANAGMYVQLLSQNQEELRSEYLRNGNGFSAELTADTVYYVNVYYSDGTADYSVKLGIPQELMVLENLDTPISGEMTYAGQKDRFQYTAPLSGRYCFIMSDNNAAARYSFVIWDSRNNEVGREDNMAGGTQYTLDLTEGETYYFHLEQRDAYASYQLSFGVPRAMEVMDPEVNTVSGTMTYYHQMDRFTYVAPVTGRYRLDINDANANARYWLYVFDYRENIVNNYDGIWGGEGLTMDLEAGQSYRIEVTQKEEYTDYTLNFGVPLEVQELPEGASAMGGEMKYVDQLDRFLLTPTRNQNYDVICSTNNANMKIRVLVDDSRGNRIAEHNMWNGDVFQVELSKGETYRVYVDWEENYGNYQLDIQKHAD